MRHKGETTRLRLFAASTGLFPDEWMIKPAQHSIMLDVVDAIGNAMDAERALTQCRRDQLFLRWGEVNELFVPSRYVQLGFEKAFEHEHPETRELLLPKMASALEALQLGTVRDCELQAMRGGHRACVLGKKLAADFVPLDEVLEALVRAHEKFVEARRLKAHRVFRKFDANGDGVFDHGEVRAR